MIRQLGVVDRSDDRPPYRQIAALLRTAIESGDFTAGAKLPSEAQLTEHFGVARMTARQALQELKAEGLVLSEHGKGVFVRPRPPLHRLTSDRFARGDDEHQALTVDRSTITRTTAPHHIAALLHLDDDAEVTVHARRYLTAGRPVELATSYVPANTELAEPARFTETVSARMPTHDERRALTIDTGIPVLLILRTAFTDTDVPVEVCDTIKVAPAYQLEYSFPAR